MTSWHLVTRRDAENQLHSKALRACSGQVVQQLLIQEYSETALAALVVYDYIITFEQELRCIWRKPWNRGTVLFLFNRYLTIAYATVTMISGNSAQTCVIRTAILNLQLCDSCSIVSGFSAALMISLLLTFALFSSLRAYAFSNQSITWALPIFILNMVPIGADIYNFSLDIPQSLVYFDFNLCVGDSLVPPEVELHDIPVVRASRVSAIVADTLLLILTWMRTYRISKEAIKVHLKVSVGTMMIRYGTLYFIVLLLLNVCDILLIVFTGQSYVSPFISFVTSIITSRFILNLREGNSGSSHLESWSEFSDPGLAIPSGLGNLGQPLEHCIDIETASEFHLDWTIPSSPSLSSVVDFFKEVP